MKTIGLLLPAGSGKAMLCFDHENRAVSGLDVIAKVGLGDPVNKNNPTNRPGRLKDGQRYIFEVFVNLANGDATLKVSLDGQSYVDWSGPQKALSVWPTWEVPDPRMMGVTLGDVDVTLERLELIPHDGEVLVLDDKPMPPKGVRVVQRAEAIDLLPLIDPQLDVFDGEANVTEHGLALTATPTKTARLGIPVRALGAYVLAFSLERLGAREICVGLPTTRTRGSCILDVKRAGFVASGIEMIAGDGVGERNNPATVKGTQLEIGTKHEVLFRVRPQGTRVAVEVELDGKPFCQWEGEQADWTLFKNWEIPSTQIPFIGCHESILIHSATLNMLDGEAWILRRKAEPK